MVAISSQKIAETIAAHIEKFILEGALRPGEKLASERELAHRLEVSRPSLREALELLVQRGLLTSTRNGTYVAQFLAPLIAPLAHLFRDNQNAFNDYFEFRQCVEPQAARAAAIRATDVDKTAIRGCLAEMRKAHKIQDTTQEAQVDVNLHMLVYEAGHNLVMLHVMLALSELLRSNIFFNCNNLYLRPGVRDRLLGQHVEIGEAVLSGDPNRAEAAAADHIRFVFGEVEDLQSDGRRRKASMLRVKRGDLLAS